MVWQPTFLLGGCNVCCVSNILDMRRPTYSANACGRRWDRLRSTARRASVCSTTAVPQSPYCPLSEAETRRSRLTHVYSLLSCHRCSAATDNGNLKHMANLIADGANVDDRKWPHVAAMLNGRHTTGSVTWLAFRPFDMPTPVKRAR